MMKHLMGTLLNMHVEIMWYSLITGAGHSLTKCLLSSVLPLICVCVFFSRSLDCSYIISFIW